MASVKELFETQSALLKEIKQLISHLERNNKKINTQFKKIEDKDIELPIDIPVKKAIECVNEGECPKAPTLKTVESRLNYKSEKKENAAILKNLPPL